MVEEINCFTFLQPFAGTHGVYFTTRDGVKLKEGDKLGGAPEIGRLGQLVQLKQKYEVLKKAKGKIDISTALDSMRELSYVDGAHYSPIVCFDILNSINLIKNDGFILCDDISLINYNATIDSLKVLKNEKIIDYKLIYKNIDARKNSNPKKRRFIAVVQLPSKN